jgi:peptidoglycan/xylan/chitin deacetylase (PgdA/CDA1 family)
VVTTAVKASLRRTSVLLDRLRPPNPGVVILIYHRVGARTPTSVDLPTSLFDEQMAYLSERCRPITLDRAVETLTAAQPPADPRPAVVVTFDDGTDDFVEEALPSLLRHGVPVTYYLATDFVERNRAFPDDGRPMSWAAAQEAISTGLVDVGSHTHTHALLDRITAEAAAVELDRSIGLITDRLGTVPNHFAYPKALLGTAANQAEVRTRFRTATVARTRPNPYGSSDLHQLTRSPIQVSDGLEFFEHKVAGGMHLESDVRDLVNRWRYRDALR